MRPSPAIRFGLMFRSVFCVCVGMLASADVAAQNGPRPVIAPPTVFVEEPEQSHKQLLEQAAALTENGRWDDALELYLKVQQDATGRLVRIATDRFRPVEEYCQARIAGFPPEALAVYRRRVDARAERLYKQGVAERDPRPLRTVAFELFASSWGDDALWTLSELDLRDGMPSRARDALRHLRSDLPDADRAGELRYPDSEIPPAEIAARLVLCTIAERRWTAAETELRGFAIRYPNTEGRLGGKSGLWRELLTNCLTRAARATRIQHRSSPRVKLEPLPATPRGIMFFPQRRACEPSRGMRRSRCPVRGGPISRLCASSACPNVARPRSRRGCWRSIRSSSAT
ncbi:MAG: hypothetical protein QM811_26700 [Pirellulales bacterium]